MIPSKNIIPGEYHFANGDIELHAGLKPITIKVTNKGDRPCQIGSHLHFFEANPALDFDRSKAWGKHLDIPSGASVRLEPGQSKEVNLIDFTGAREVYGFDERVEGPLDSQDIKKRSQDYSFGTLQHKPEFLPDYSLIAMKVEITPNEHTKTYYKASAKKVESKK